MAIRVQADKGGTGFMRTPAHSILIGAQYAKRRAPKPRRRPEKHETRRFLHLVYTRPWSLYEIFRRFPLTFTASKQTLLGMVMDIVFIGLIAAFFAAVCGFAVACDTLGGPQ
ncbi:MULTISPECIES: hypothetical protein [unclassified Janthinobacterium]|uniref:hypothetical protein n=1 Tax=unclassified Janthinobacterium TaxID=2610881 RepID=UPI0018DECFE8|nr:MULTISPECIES: hypothetical protein [unclassified Janthinobacterium]MEC5161746.1 VanZ family protein [Janthinobacterium sp. CG_S6]